MPIPSPRIRSASPGAPVSPCPLILTTPAIRPFRLSIVIVSLPSPALTVRSISTPDGTKNCRVPKLSSTSRTPPLSRIVISSTPAVPVTVSLKATPATVPPTEAPAPSVRVFVPAPPSMFPVSVVPAPSTKASSPSPPNRFSILEKPGEPETVPIRGSFVARFVSYRSPESFAVRRNSSPLSAPANVSLPVPPFSPPVMNPLLPNSIKSSSAPALIDNSSGVTEPPLTVNESSPAPPRTPLAAPPATPAPSLKINVSISSPASIVPVTAAFRVNESFP